MTDCRDISPADTAKLVRAALRASYPGTKFSVRTSTYSMGASISVAWTDGPASVLVDATVSCFGSGTYDSVQDYHSHRDCWLLPGGRAKAAERDEPAPCAKAERVRFGADSVTCSRVVTAAVAARALAKLERDGAPAGLLAVKTHAGDDHAWIEIAGIHIASARAEAQVWEDRARRLLPRFMVAAT